MIDDPREVERLLEAMRARLPLPAIVSPPLAKLIREQGLGSAASRRCRILSADYAGDEGGILCKIDLGSGDSAALYCSLTHVIVTPGMALAREIAAYQKHRTKRLRRNRSG